MKRVVVTGIGVVSCLGNNQDEVYKSLLNSKSGITFSIEGPPEPITIPVLKLLTSLSSKPESLIASFIAL